MITKRNRLAVACLITVAVILLGIAYAQDAPVRADRADTSKSMSHFHEDEDSRYLIAHIKQSKMPWTMPKQEIQLSYGLGL